MEYTAISNERECMLENGEIIGWLPVEIGSVMSWTDKHERFYFREANPKKTDKKVVKVGSWQTQEQLRVSNEEGMNFSFKQGSGEKISVTCATPTYELTAEVPFTEIYRVLKNAVLNHVNP